MPAGTVTIPAASAQTQSPAAAATTSPAATAAGSSGAASATVQSPTPTTATSAAAETAGATATTPPTPAATAAAPQADQTGVGTSLIALDFRTPQALLTARTANPDGTVSVTWVRTEEQARQTCQIQDRPCSDDTYQQYWAKYANETGSATADCQGMTLVTANLDRDGQTHTFVNSGEDTWTDTTLGTTRDSSSAGGGGAITRVWKAACQPESS